MAGQGVGGPFRNPTEDGQLTAAELLWVMTGESGIVLLQEQASSPSATAGYGKIYAKTDGHLYFMNDAGTETQIDVSASSPTPVTPAGTVDGSNTAFTVASAPKWVISDGITYFSGAGYSYALGTITMDIPPSQYIRAIL